MADRVAENQQTVEALAAEIRRWLGDEHIHNPYCAVQKGKPCDCDTTRQAPARAALRDLVAQAEAGRQVLRAAEEWAYQRKKWIDGQSAVGPLRDAEANLVHAVLAARLDGAR